MSTIVFDSAVSRVWERGHVQQPVLCAVLRGHLVSLWGVSVEHDIVDNIHFNIDVITRSFLHGFSNQYRSSSANFTTTAAATKQQDERK